MRWLRRSLWIAAWLAWLAAGAGLYRELPRELGPAVARIPRGTARGVGFVGDTNLFAQIVTRAANSSTIDLYNAETGEPIYSKPGVGIGQYFWPKADPRRRPLVFARLCNVDNNEFKSSGICKFDLVSGEWESLSKRDANDCVLHPTKPLIAYVDRSPTDTGKPGCRAVLLNWETRDETVVREANPDAIETCRPYFVPDRDWLVLEIERRKLVANAPRSAFLEVWKLGAPPELVKRIEDLSPGRRLSASHNGRTLVIDPHGVNACTFFDIFDAAEGRKIFSNAPTNGHPTATDPAAMRVYGDPVISESGRRALGGSPPTLWDVDSGKVIWQCEDPLTFADQQENVVLHAEECDRYLKKWFAGSQLQTLAIRDFEDGRLLVRMFANRNFTVPRDWNAARTLGVANDGTVHRLPLAVNWLLLAGCQAILAAPIVGLWTILWWRRRRKRTAVASIDSQTIR